MRYLICLFACLMGVCVQAEAFGRFGYEKWPTVPGFEIGEFGFRAKTADGDRMNFNSATPLPRVVAVSSMSATYFLAGAALSPDKLRVNLAAPGFELHFNHGFRFKVGAIQSPYLSWEGASVGPNVPTAPSDWILVSFRDRQPPILLSFVDGPIAAKVVGKPGDWRIQSTESFSGWVRVILPFGLVSQSSNSAEELGVQTQLVLKNAQYFTGPAPLLIDVTARKTESGVEGVWRFDRPGAMVPSSLHLAAQGGYKVDFVTATHTIQAPTEEGPTGFCNEPKMVIRFPMHAIPPGRSLVTGDPQPTVSAETLSEVVELALRSRLANRTRGQESAAQESISRFLSLVRNIPEPHTEQRLPFAATGEGLSLAAAHALLHQAVFASAGIPNEPNALRTSVEWRFDGLSWLIWASDVAEARRASALLSVADAMSDDPAVQLRGAMLQVGLCAEKARGAWLATKGFKSSEAKLPDPMSSLRSSLYGGIASDMLFNALSSPVRVLSPEPIEARGEASPYHFIWFAGLTQPELVARDPMELWASRNVKGVKLELLGDISSVRYEPINSSEPCVALLRCSALPKLAEIKYSE